MNNYRIICFVNLQNKLKSAINLIQAFGGIVALF